MKVGTVLLLCLVVGAYGQSDSCHSAHTDEKSCVADDKCSWCLCEALPSACWTKADAAKLPSGVYKCTNSSVEDAMANSTGNVMLMSLTNPGSPLGKQHCLQLINPRGTDSPFFKSEGWRYPHPPWINGTCPKKFNYLNRHIANLSGFAGVDWYEYGIQV
eukprot:g2342.t1